jgi:hypothetical protein
LGSGDSALKSRLEGLGYAVTVKSDSAGAADAAGKDVVVISATVTSTNVNTKFRALAAPVVVAEPQLYDDMGMTAAAASNYGSTSGQTKVTIASGSHPLTAGLTGTPTVTRAADTFNWGVPGAAAVKGATVPASPTHSTSFGYDAGATMPGLAAPARRVGFFPSNTTATNLTTDGWKLFDAAIRWADG